MGRQDKGMLAHVARRLRVAPSHMRLCEGCHVKTTTLSTQILNKVAAHGRASLLRLTQRQRHDISHTHFGRIHDSCTSPATACRREVQFAALSSAVVTINIAAEAVPEAPTLPVPTSPRPGPC
jgi:hypothetical protein